MKKIFLLIIMFIVTVPAISMAQNYKLLEPLPCVDSTCTGIKNDIDLNGYIGYIFKFSIALAAFLAVVMIIFGGFEYMTSEIPFVKSNGKDKIWNAIIGLFMVLASYLILATIDPRLVEINTTLTPININTEAVTQYQTQLGNDIRNLSAATQAEIVSNTAERDRLQVEKVLLQEKLANGEINEIEYDTYDADLNSQISNLTVKINKNKATVIGQTSYATAYNNIKAQDGENGVTNLSQYTANPVPNQLVDGQYPTNSLNVIQNQYNSKINEVLKTTAPEAQKLAEVQILEKQRDFYIAQVKDEVKLNDLLKIIQPGAVYNQDSPLITSITTKRAEYQANIADPKKAEDVGVPIDVYNKIMSVRIDEINSVLAPK